MVTSFFGVILWLWHVTFPSKIFQYSHNPTVNLSNWSKRAGVGRQEKAAKPQRPSRTPIRNQATSGPTSRFALVNPSPFFSNRIFTRASYTVNFACYCYTNSFNLLWYVPKVLTVLKVKWIFPVLHTVCTGSVYLCSQQPWCNIALCCSWQSLSSYDENF